MKREDLLKKTFKNNPLVNGGRVTMLTNGVSPQLQALIFQNKNNFTSIIIFLYRHNFIFYHLHNTHDVLRAPTPVIINSPLKQFFQIITPRIDYYTLYEIIGGNRPAIFLKGQANRNLKLFMESRIARASKPNTPGINYRNILKHFNTNKTYTLQKQLKLAATYET